MLVKQSKVLNFGLQEKWDNFLQVIGKAKIACESINHKISDHFADVGKTIKMPKGAEK